MSFNRLLIATHNAGKLREFQRGLAGIVPEMISAADLGLPEPEETGASFAENALLKARAAAEASNMPALADDSGLCVNALGGNPGIYSARWGGERRDFMLAMRRVHDELGDAADRSAYFICVLALVRPDGSSQIVEGRCEGDIVWPPRGNNGHGYDPFFVPAGHSRAFAEMTDDEKGGLSHRGAAMRELAKTLRALK